MAGQALKITEERLTDAEQLYKPNGDIQREQTHFGRQRSVADKEARHEYEQRCEEKRENTQPQRNKHGLLVAAKIRLHPRIGAPNARQIIEHVIVRAAFLAHKKSPPLICLTRLDSAPLAARSSQGRPLSTTRPSSTTST